MSSLAHLGKLGKNTYPNGMQSKIIHKSCGKEKNSRPDNRVICRKFPGAVMTFPVLSVF